jgi:hypothetical protein
VIESNKGGKIVKTFIQKKKKRREKALIECHE